MKNYTKKNKGFTLIEILIVVGILAVLIAVVSPAFSTMRNNEVLKSTTADIVSAIDKARSQTLASVNSLEYGVHFESSKIVIFQGTTYSSGDANNEDIFISSPASISNINLTGGAVDVYFDRLSGAPSKTGTITVSVSSSTKTITISTTGAVSTN